MSSPTTPRSPRETCKLDAANRSFQKSQAQLLDKHLYCIANILERIPSLRQLEDTVGIKYILQYLFHVEIQRHMASLKVIITEIIKALTRKASQPGISFGIDLVGTLGSGPESLNANQSECAPNSDPLPNPCAFNSYRTTWPLIDYKETIDKIMLLLLSDATLLRHCMEKGESINRAFAVAAVCVSNNASQDQTSSGLSSFAAALDAYFGPIERKILALQNVTDYDSSHSFSGGSDDFTTQAVVSEELFASQLAQNGGDGIHGQARKSQSSAQFWR